MIYFYIIENWIIIKKNNNYDTLENNFGCNINFDAELITHVHDDAAAGSLGLGGEIKNGR